MTLLILSISKSISSTQISSKIIVFSEADTYNFLVTDPQFLKPSRIKRNVFLEQLLSN